jgi:hypothetical protein
VKHRIFQFATMAFCLAVAMSFGHSQDLGSLSKQTQSLGGIGDLSSVGQMLHLSPEQMQKVMPILQAEVPKLQAIQGKTGLTGPQKVTEAKAVQQQSDSKLKGILSPQQFGSLKNFRASQLQSLLGSVPH